MKHNKLIFQRCQRELNNSSSLDMLEVAKRYSDLFLLTLNIDPVFKKKMSDVLSSIYKLRLKRL